MKIKEVSARKILDSRQEETIEVSVKTESGLFSSSSPSGKSKGRNEASSYIRNIDNDINQVSELELGDIDVERFTDLIEIEKITSGKIGANSLFALESSILKSLALEQDKQLWELINEKASKIPIPIGNCIGGGIHTKLLNSKKPDFQEFHVIPYVKNFSDAVFLMYKAREIIKKELKARRVLGEENDENAFSTSLDNEKVLELMNKVIDEVEESSGEKIGLGIDVASSGFFNSFYKYRNPIKILKREEQIDYICNLAKDFGLNYIEDPLQEEDFSGFREIKEKVMRTKPACLIAGDDLICSNVERLKKAIIGKSVNAIILKPNQTGSLIEIAKLVNIARKYGIVTIMSHRSGETLDYALADLAFGFSCDFVKFGITGKEREIKLKRLIDISKSEQ